MADQNQVAKVLKNNPKPIGKGVMVDASGYVINRDVKLPPWVKCHICGKPPTPTDWLKPVSPDPKCRKLIHLSHIPNGPVLSQEAGFIARNS